MSIKILTGVKFKSQNIQEVLSQLKELKPTAEQISLDSLTYDDIQGFITENYTEDKIACSWGVYQAMRNDLCKQERLNSSFNFLFTLLLYPHLDGNIYGVSFAELGDVHTNLLSEISEPFPYWNNVDKPFDLTEEEWAYRRSVWDELIPDKTFTHHGLEYSIVGPNEFSYKVLQWIRTSIESFGEQQLPEPNYEILNFNRQDLQTMGIISTEEVEAIPPEQMQEIGKLAGEKLLEHGDYWTCLGEALKEVVGPWATINIE